MKFVVDNIDAIELYEKFEKYGSMIIKAFIIFTVLILTSFFIYALSLGYMEYCDNKKQYQILYCYGLSGKSIKIIVFLQHFIVYFLSFIISAICSTIAILLIVNKLKNISSEILKYEIIDFMLIYLVSFILGMVIVALIILFITKIEKRKNRKAISTTSLN